MYVHIKMKTLCKTGVLVISITRIKKRGQLVTAQKDTTTVKYRQFKLVLFFSCQ